MNNDKKLVEMHTDIKWIKNTLGDIKPEVKKNTAFREKATGVITFIALCATTLGGGVVYIISKTMGK